MGITVQKLTSKTWMEFPIAEPVSPPTFRLLCPPPFRDHTPATKSSTHTHGYRGCDALPHLSWQLLETVIFSLHQGCVREHPFVVNGRGVSSGCRSYVSTDSFNLPRYFKKILQVTHKKPIFLLWHYSPR